MPGLDGDTQYPGAGVLYGTLIIKHMLGQRLWDRDALVEKVMDADIRFSRDVDFMWNMGRRNMNNSIDRMLELGHLQRDGDYIRVMENEDFARV